MTYTGWVITFCILAGFLVLIALAILILCTFFFYKVKNLADPVPQIKQALEDQKKAIIKDFHQRTGILINLCRPEIRIEEIPEE